MFFSFRKAEETHVMDCEVLQPSPLCIPGEQWRSDILVYLEYEIAGLSLDDANTPVLHWKCRYRSASCQLLGMQSYFKSMYMSRSLQFLDQIGLVTNRCIYLSGMSLSQPLVQSGH